MQTVNASHRKMGLILPFQYWAILIVALVGLFLIGLDQGQTLSIVMGKAASGQMFLHELFHDIRHAAGFACH